MLVAVRRIKMEIFLRFRKYLILWAVIGVALVVYTLVKYKDFLWSVIVDSASAVFSEVITCAIIIGVIVYLIRIMFR